MTSRAGLRAAAAVVSAAATTLAVLPVQAAPPTRDRAEPAPVPRAVVFAGHGYGHGHGMSQYGAQGAGLKGVEYRTILRFYYPGTLLGHVGGGLRVLLTADTSSDVSVRPAPGLRVRDLADGERWRLPTGQVGASAWRIAPTNDDASVSSVQYRDGAGWHRWNLPGRTVLRGDAQFRADTPLFLELPSGTVRGYRGVLRSASPSPRATTRDTVNVTSADSYVRGVLPAEMPTSWSMPALRAQAVAARTYATWSRSTAGNGHWDVCDTTSCQVYGGVGSETERGNAAVAGTAREILRHDGRPAFTQFSSSSGGWTAAGGQPYLPAHKDPWDDWPGNANHDWEQTVEASTIESRYPSIGRLRTVDVTSRDGHGEWGGRVRTVVLRGSNGNVSLSGDDLLFALGLRSTWFKPQITGLRLTPLRSRRPGRRPRPTWSRR